MTFIYCIVPSWHLLTSNSPRLLRPLWILTIQLLELTMANRFARAWTGVLKHRLLGNPAKMHLQAEAMARAVKPINCRRAPKPLFDAWIKGDWSSFRKAQEKSFKALWDRMRKDRFVVSENEEKIAVEITRGGAITTSWCWADNGLALIAAREGIEISYDPLWLPTQSML